MVKWSRPAKLDLKQIHGYIAKDSRYYAKKVANNIVEKTEELKELDEARNDLLTTEQIFEKELKKKNDALARQLEKIKTEHELAQQHAETNYRNKLADNERQLALMRAKLADDIEQQRLKLVKTQAWQPAFSKIKALLGDAATQALKPSAIRL